MLTTKSDSIQSLKFAILILLITNRGEFGDIGLLAFYAVCVIFIVRDSLYMPVFKYLILLITPMIISFIAGFVQHGYYDVFKDIYYFLSPIFTTYVGCIMARHAKIKVLKSAFLIAGLVTAISFIIKAFVEAGAMAFLDPRTARNENSLLINSAAFLSLGVLLWNITTEYKHMKHPVSNMLMFIINVFAIYISGSRTFYVASLVYMFVVAYPYVKKHIVRFAILGVAVGVGMAFLILSNPNNSTVEILMHSADEMTISNYSRPDEINNNYRGYEAFRAMSQFDGYSLGGKLFGGGFGEKVDLIYSPLDMRYVPILHNGYPYILIKTGYFGMLCFVLYGLCMVRMMMKRWDKGSAEIRMLCGMGIGGVLVGFIVNASVWGLFNHGYNILLMMSGIFIYYYNKTNQGNRVIKRTLGYGSVGNNS